MRYFFLALVCVVCGWFARGWYAEHGAPVRVDVQVRTEKPAPKPVAAPVRVQAPKPVQAAKAPPKPAPVAEEWHDDGVVPWDGSKANGVGYYHL